MQKAVFLDRDGTLNYDSNYVYRLEDLVILPWVQEWLHMLKDAWFLLIIVTNQSGINRWLYSYDAFVHFTDHLARAIPIVFDAVYCCPHRAEEHCICRKPKIQHLLDAQQKFSIDMHQSFFVGDKETDVLCGKNAWCISILLGNDVNSSAHFQVSSFLDAVQRILWLSTHSMNSKKSVNI